MRLTRALRVLLPGSSRSQHMLRDEFGMFHGTGLAPFPSSLNREGIPTASLHSVYTDYVILHDAYDYLILYDRP